MITIILAGLTLGTIGSFHCIGMCGPLALSLPLSNKSDFEKFTGSFLYNFGRIITYSLLGLFFGFIGKGFSLFGFQQWLSIVMGLLMVVLVLLPKRWVIFRNDKFFLTKFTIALRQLLGRLLFSKKYSSLLAIGLLNGLLPCGFIYMAITGAVATASPIYSMVFMAGFGFGTLPVMWSIVFFGNYISIEIRKKIRSAYPVMLMLMGLLLIIRGMGLNIPYISPGKISLSKPIEICIPDNNISGKLKIKT